MPVPTKSVKFAGLKRFAAEEPEAMSTAIDSIKSKLQDLLNNLTVLQENLGAVKIEDEGQPQPGEPIGAVTVVSGPERMAGLKRTAADEPEQVEEAIGDFYLGLDEVMSLTENLADHLDVDLPEGGEGTGEAEVEVEDPAEFDGEAKKDEKKDEKNVGKKDE